MSDNELILNRAKAAVISHDYSLASRLYKSLLKNKPQDVNLLSQLGSLYVKSGADNLALPVFKEIISLKSNDFNALNNLGGIYRRLKKYSESVAVLEQALATGENDTQVSYNLGFTYKLMGNYDDAIACFEDVVAQNPSDVLAFNHIGAIHALQGDYEKAISSYERGLKIDPNHPVLQLNLAKSCESIGKYDKAISSYESALRSKPGWLEAIDDYASLLLKMNRTREASDVVLQAIRLNPKDVKMHTRLGTVYTRQSDFANAKSEYKEALSNNKKYSPALLGLAHAQESLGENEDAVITMQEVETDKPDDAEMLKQFAHILISANHLNAASQKLEKLWKKNPNDVQILNLLGQYYICKGDEKKTNGCWKQIDTVNPTYYDYLRDGALRYSQVGNLSSSEKYLLKFLEKKPNDVAALTALAADYEALKKFNEALRTYTQALKIDGNNFLTRNGIARIKKQMIPEETPKKVEEEINNNEEQPKDANTDFEENEIAEIKMDATDSQFESAEENNNEEDKDTKKDDFDFDQFGIENLAKEEPIDPFTFEDPDEIGSGSPLDVDEQKLDSLADDDDQPIDDDDVQPVSTMMPETSSAVEAVPAKPSDFSPFKAENIDSDDDDNDFIIPDDLSLPEQQEQPEEQKEEPPEELPEEKNKKSQEDLQEEQAVENNKEKNNEIEQKLKDANAAAEKALYAAQQAWSSAQHAADSAQAVDDARNNPPPLDEVPAKEESDSEKELAPSSNEKQEEMPKSIELEGGGVPFTEPEPDVSEYDEEMAKATALFEKAVNTLPAIVNVLIDHNMIDKFKTSLEMFKKLRAMSEYLPSVKREAFMSSKTRLLLDYIISKLSGEPGLLATSEALRKSGVLMNMASPSMPAESGTALVSRVLNEMQKYVTALPDRFMSKALNTTVSDTLKKL